MTSQSTLTLRALLALPKREQGPFAHARFFAESHLGPDVADAITWTERRDGFDYGFLTDDTDRIELRFELEEPDTDRIEVRVVCEHDDDCHAAYALVNTPSDLIAALDGDSSGFDDLYCEHHDRGPHYFVDEDTADGYWP